MDILELDDMVAGSLALRRIAELQADNAALCAQVEILTDAKQFLFAERKALIAQVEALQAVANQAEFVCGEMMGANVGEELPIRLIPEDRREAIYALLDMIDTARDAGHLGVRP